MAVFSSSKYLLAFLLLNLHLEVMDADPNLTFYFKNIGKVSNFKSQLALFGDAMVGGDNFSVQIGVSTAGRFVSKEPLNLVQEKSRQLVSFSNYFSFSMSGVDGDGLAFVMLPSQFPLNVFDDGEMGFLKERMMKFLAIEFDTFKCCLRLLVSDVGSPVSAKVSNVSSFNLVLNGGEKLQAWVDYEASSKRFEVRLNKFGLSRLIDPLLTYSIDLSKMWGSENVVVGFSSSSANSSQRNIIHS
ncbi:L-type lectin-domain containing receptor kinase IV.2-like [Salvia splendens]|uniref:L-type lectin-domain containing receptor kinase IV.2-like n=1 Tax=Salvia splendens TaxID=180675 RepID=UPI001C26540D|nr:L-type lectin-domain containing receptor kinase IV.2-like [Salvia splendens]